MRQRLLASLPLLLAAATTALAQFPERIHRTFPTAGVEEVRIDVVDSVTVERWAGNVILVQTDVRLFNTTEGLYRYLTGEAGRYEVTSSREGATLNIMSAEPERKSIETSVGVLEEEVHVKVLLPEDFEGVDGGPYVLRGDEAGL